MPGRTNFGIIRNNVFIKNDQPGPMEIAPMCW